jgi:hypothetical protein
MTLALRIRAGSDASNNGSIRTSPVNQSADPFVGFCKPLFDFHFFSIDRQRPTSNLTIAALIGNNFVANTQIDRGSHETF